MEKWMMEMMENGHFEWQDNTAGFSNCGVVCVVSATKVYYITIHYSFYCCLKPEVLYGVVYQFSGVFCSHSYMQSSSSLYLSVY
jgi:hypothetical protein